MADGRQERATSFDPAPQFAVHSVQVVDDGRLIVTGRCLFEPCVIGSVFTRVVRQDDEGWVELGPCRLEVDSIALYYLYIDRLEQQHSARVWLLGSSEHLAEPADTGGRLVLVGEPPAEGSWRLDDGFWAPA